MWSTGAGDSLSWLTARKPGFLDDPKEQRQIEATPGTEIIISLMPEALIKGRVTVSAADAASGVNVQIFSQQVQDGMTRWMPGTSGRTNSNGEFRFAELLPGAYKLVTNEWMDNDPVATDPSSQQYGFPPVFYPSATNFAAATTIQVTAGQTYQADLSIIRQPYYPVTIPVANSESSAGVGITVSPHGYRSPGYSLGYVASKQTIEGSLPKGNYLVEAATYGPNQADGSVTLAVPEAAGAATNLILIRKSSITVNVVEEFTSTNRNGSMSWSDGHSNFALRGPRVYLQDIRLEVTDDFEQRGGGSLRQPTGPNDESLVLENLTPGRYWLHLHPTRGYVVSATRDGVDLLRQPLVDTQTLTLRLAPDAVISGRVLDDVGEPIRHATVTLYYDDHSRGIDQIHQSRGAQTDDQGAYELTPLQPGTYFLSASAKPWYAVHPISEPDGQRESSRSPSVDRSLDVAYPVTYYPDVTDAESATPIPIRGGEHVQLDIHFSPVPALRLLFHVPYDGKNGVTFPQLQQSTFDRSTFVQSDGGRMFSPGLLEITGIPAGRYNLRFLSPGQSAQMDGVDLTRDGEEIYTSKSAALSTVKVSVRIPEEATLPPRLVVGVRSGPRTPAVWAAVNAKGELEFKQLPPGRYEVLAGTPGKPYSVSPMAAEGADASGHTLTVAAGSAPLVSLTLVGGSVEVQGVAKRAGKAFAGAMVVLMPKNPESDRDLFRRDQSDLDGTFSLRGVIPGLYTVIAIENGWDLDWSQPGVIAAYRKHGRTIQVGNQGARLMNVTEPIEVQSK